MQRTVVRDTIGDHALGHKSFQVAAPSLWNTLPIGGYDFFKGTIKTCMLKNAFACNIYSLC